MGIGGSGHILFANRAVGRQAGLRPDRGHEHQTLNLAARRSGKLAHGLGIDAGVEFIGERSWRVRDTGEMDQMRDALQEPRPSGGMGKIGHGHALDAAHGGDR